MRVLLFLILTSLTLAGCSGGGTSQATSDANAVYADVAVQQGIVTEATAEKVTLLTSRGTATYLTGNAVVKLNGTTVSPTDLKQGMYVTIEVDSGTALNINCDSVLEGMIEQIDILSKSFVVLGQKVIMTSLTVFESGAEFNTLTIGQKVVVYGYFKSIGVITATRIEVKPADTAVSLTGLVANLDTKTMTFDIQAILVDYSAALLPTEPLLNGLKVKVDGSLNTAGTLMATKITLVVKTGTMELKGVVSDYDPVAGTFFIRDQKVKITPDTRFEDDKTAADLSNGITVEVEGQIVAGVLIAGRIQLELETNNTNSPMEIEGIVSDYDPVAGTFFVKNRKVQITMDTRFGSDSTTANLSNGIMVEVEGRIVAGVLIADEITLEEEIRINNNGKPLEIEGIVSDYDPVAGTFFVKNRKVQITMDTRFEDNKTAADLSNGIMVEVKGKIVAAVLIADEITLEEEIRINNNGKPMEIKGIVSDYDPVAATFFVKNRKVQITMDTRFEDNKTAADLSNGVTVEVEGKIVAGILIAQKIEIDSGKMSSD